MADKKSLSVSILIVSDTAHKDSSKDASGGILNRVFETSETINWRVHDTSIVPDAIPQIQEYLKRTAGECNLIVTTGGTGFASKDVTPEAVEVLLTKKAPGLV